MPEPPRYEIRLAKEDFKFSAAHFTLFPGGRAELLHGHNYRVRVVLAGGRLDQVGLLLDVAAVKRRIRASCRALDERTLIPDRADRAGSESRLDIRSDGAVVEIRFDGRTYRLPADDVVLVPMENVSIELLARRLWDEIAPELVGTPVETLSVEVEETPGQSCAYRAAVETPPAAPRSPAHGEGGKGTPPPGAPPG